MNEIKISDKRPPLSTGQELLLKLFLNYYQTEKVIPKKEIFDIYKNKVAIGYTTYSYKQKDENGDVVLSKYGHPVYTYVDRPWSEWTWSNYFEAWFLRNLGALLKKGYLKIVPAFELVDKQPLIIEDKGES